VQATVAQRHLDHVAAGLLHGLLHGHGHFTRLAFAHAHAAIAITDDGECGETEDTTALDHLGHAVDRDHPLAKTVLVRFVLDVCLKLSHVVYPVSSELQAGLAGGVCKGLDATVVCEAGAIERDLLDTGGL